MATTTEAIELGGRAELHGWYFGHLRPLLLEAVGDGILEPAAVEELDYQLAGLLGPSVEEDA